MTGESSSFTREIQGQLGAYDFPHNAFTQIWQCVRNRLLPKEALRPPRARSWGGFEGDGDAGPVARVQASVHGLPGDGNGRDAGGVVMAPAVVLVDRLGAALIFTVKGVSVEEPACADQACACVVVPDDFGEDEFAGLRGIDGVRHGEISCVSLEAYASGGSVERRGGCAGDVVQEEAEV